jgi:hypothetical protein
MRFCSLVRASLGPTIGDRSLRSPLMSIGDGRAKEHLIQVFLLRRVDYLGDLQPLGQKAHAPINLA